VYLLGLGRIPQDFIQFLLSAIAQPVMGKASDIFGHRKIFLIGLVVTFMASLMAPLIQTTKVNQLGTLKN
jgi:MFS family permease